MPGGWSNDDDDTITVPAGATTGPRVVVGAEAQPLLNSLDQQAGILLYTTDHDCYVISAENNASDQLRITLVNDLTLTVAGSYLIENGALYTYQPNNPGFVDNWNTLVLSGGWTNFGGGFATAAYRKVASPPASLQVKGVCNTNAGFANGTVIANLPVGYRPLEQIRVGVTSANPVAGGRSPSLDIQTNGNIFILGLAAVATTVEFNFVIPLNT